MDAILHDYQKQVGNFMIHTPKCGTFLEMGLGKTLVALAVTERLYNHPQEKGHILVIAPKSIARATWACEIEKWHINIPYKSLIVNEKGKQLSRAKRLEAYAEAYKNPVKTMYFINQDLLVDLVNWCPVNDKNQKIWAFQTVIVDELQGFKGHDSARFKALRSVSPAIHRFIGLTGTPTPNGIEDLWAEVALMDDGFRLGKNISTFRRNFMMPGFVNDKGIVCSYNPIPGIEPVIYQKIKDIVVSMKNTTLQLPPLTSVIDTVYMSKKEADMYKTFQKKAVLYFGSEDNVATAVNAAVMHGKLAQLASGTVYTVDSEGHSTGRWEVVHKQKLERLLYIRNNTPDNLLVAYYYKSELEEIKNYLKQNNIPFEVFDSNNALDIQTRWNKGEIPLLLAHPASAGAGLNLQDGGHTLVFYTLPERLENYLQIIGRLHRQGQKNPVIIHYIMTAGTYDKQNYDRLLKKDESEQSLIEAVQMYLKDDTEIPTYG